ncbi:MAG: acetate--CoA ligase, partial [Thermomicrobiales bacterium]
MTEQTGDHHATIEALFAESRTFSPPSDFVNAARLADPAIYDDANADPEGFWAKQAESLSWFRKWDQVLEWDPPFAKWFLGGKLNVAYNCLDRHVEAGRGDRVAFHWEGEPGDRKSITYAELLKEVSRTANALKELGVKKGDRVAVYMPMILEAPIALLACARIGAPHTMVFGGFSAESLRDRINDAECTVVITADGGYRRGAAAALKPNVDAALEGAPSVQKVLVAKRTGEAVTMVDGRDVWWDEIVDRQSDDCPPEHMDSEDMLFLLYTSGTTARPKGIVHTTAGYLLGCSFTHKAVFDIKDDDVYWCAADIGWVTGHSYIVYGPLANGSTSVMYEGTPTYPAPDRWWDIIERYKVSILYCAPTAIRAHMKEGHQHTEGHDLSSLRLLGSVGEPINPEAWIWYHTHIGGGKAPIVDTWWQTETGSIMISPLPGITTTKPGSATFAIPGIDADIVT